MANVAILNVSRRFYFRIIFKLRVTKRWPGSPRIRRIVINHWDQPFWIPFTIRHISQPGWDDVEPHSILDRGDPATANNQPSLKSVEPDPGPSRHHQEAWVFLVCVFVCQSNGFLFWARNGCWDHHFSKAEQSDKESRLEWVRSIRTDNEDGGRSRPKAWEKSCYAIASGRSFNHVARLNWWTSAFDCDLFGWLLLGFCTTFVWCFVFSLFHNGCLARISSVATFHLSVIFM